MIKSAVLDINTKAFYYDEEWKPSKTKGNFKLKRKTAMSISLIHYQNDGLIEDHTRYNIIKSYGLLMSTGLEKYPISDNMQLLTIGYGPGTKGGELFFVKTNGRKQIIAQSKSIDQWTWISIRIPRFKSISADPIVNGTKMVFLTQVRSSN